jgi:asparagine synthase (glutamine-hydrolysing)
MSAIAGIFYLDRQPVERDHLSKMLDTLAHRGSDGANIWCENNVGLVHRMLWTTPESLLETLPLEKDNLVITADARIDNRDELISALELSDLPKEKITDSDLILAAYQKWGEDCPTRLLGDFAFAIWDKREQILFCARDPMGVKPFYYYSSGNIFIFASEIKALFTSPYVPCNLNEPMVADYLAKILFNGRKEDSFYQDIVELYLSLIHISEPTRR